MKTPLFYVFITTLAFATWSCKKDKPSFCSKEIGLGEFSTTVELPYDSFEYVLLLGDNGDTASLSINHPELLSSASLFYHQSPVRSYESDCEANKTVEHYTWDIREKRSSLLIVGDSTLATTEFLIKALPLVNESKPENGPVGHFYQFFEEDPFSGNIRADAFMSIMAIETLAGQGSTLEFGYVNIGVVTIAGKNYQNVYTNTAGLASGIKNIYYSFDEGLVGIKDASGVVWAVME